MSANHASFCGTCENIARLWRSEIAGKTPANGPASVINEVVSEDSTVGCGLFPAQRSNPPSSSATASRINGLERSGWMRTGAAERHCFNCRKACWNAHLGNLA